MDRREYVSAHLDVSPGTEKRLETPSSDTPFRILLLGDFSGRGNRRAATEPRLGGRKAIAIDLDNYEDALARLRAQIEIPGPDGPIRLQFESLDDFHPEALYEHVALFRELRAQQDVLLSSPAPPPPRRPTPAAAPSDPVPGILGSGSLLDDILSGVESPAPARERPRDAFAQHIHDIVSPHLHAKPSAEQEQLAAQVEDTISLAMRVVLHHPEFQDLEAAWRSLDFLLRRLDLGGDLQLHIVDLSKQELLDDVSQADDLQSTGLYRLLVEEAGGTAGETPWAVIAGLYSFDAQPAEIGALSLMGRLAREAGAPFVCSVSPRFMGTESFGAQPDSDDWRTPLDSETELAWTALRASPEAAWIGACLPRFILRDPYTKDSVESFPFEEMTVPPEHSDHLWGNPAVAVVCLVGQSFSQDGWDIQLREQNIGSLPVHSWKSDGEVHTTPCAECWMTERAADRFLSRGIMPLASLKHSDAVRLVRLQSIAQPAARLRARWSS
jgi:type VI secretion system protein ImpC